MTEKGKHLGIHALKIRMLVPLHPMPSPAMLRPKKNRRLIANETKPISVINSGDKTLKKFQLTAPTSSARSIRHILAPIDRSARSIVIKTFAVADHRRTPRQYGNQQDNRQNCFLHKRNTRYEGNSKYKYLLRFDEEITERVRSLSTL